MSVDTDSRVLDRQPPCWWDRKLAERARCSERTVPLKNRRVAEKTMQPKTKTVQPRKTVRLTNHYEYDEPSAADSTR